MTLLRSMLRRRGGWLLRQWVILSVAAVSWEYTRVERSVVAKSLVQVGMGLTDPLGDRPMDAVSEERSITRSLTNAANLIKSTAILAPATLDPSVNGLP